MYSSDNIFKHMIVIDFDFCIFGIRLDLNTTTIYITEHDCSKYEFRPQDQTNDTGRTRPHRREPQVPVCYADGGVLLLLQEVH